MMSDGYTPTKIICVTGDSIPPYNIEYVNQLATKPVGAWMMSDAREGAAAAGHVTVPEDRRKGDRLLPIERGLGGVSLHPCNLFHRLKYPHQSTNGAIDHSKDSPHG